MAPKLVFDTNKSLDKKISWYFYQNPYIAGENFWKKGAQIFHEDLAGNNSITKLVLEKYIDRFYLKEEKLLTKVKQHSEIIYQKRADIFFNVTNKIFKHHPWPKGRYVAYLSIFDFCPRFLKDKTFQIFAGDKDEIILFTIFHEMLHFIFYDYCIKNYPKIFKKLDTETGAFWELSEIFNVILQRSRPFEKIHGAIELKGYSDHKKNVEILSEKWNGDIDDWILGAIKIMNFGRN